MPSIKIIVNDVYDESKHRYLRSEEYTCLIYFGSQLAVYLFFANTSF